MFEFLKAYIHEKNTLQNFLFWFLEPNVKWTYVDFEET